LELTPGDDELRMTNMPLGVVEILSPTQSLTELITKSTEYFKAGVKSYWLALPDLKSIYVFSAPNEYEVFSKEELLMDVQLGIELPLKEIFK
jgi:Uma2 family endonuclease